MAAALPTKKFPEAVLATGTTEQQREASVTTSATEAVEGGLAEEKEERRGRSDQRSMEPVDPACDSAGDRGGGLEQLENSTAMAAVEGPLPTTSMDGAVVPSAVEALDCIPQRVRDALRIFIPLALQSEFRVACEQCPHVVAAESPPNRFLLLSHGGGSSSEGEADADDNNASAEAAWRLVQYWRHRVAAFGPFDAYQPLIGEDGDGHGDTRTEEEEDGGAVRVALASGMASSSNTALVVCDANQWYTRWGDVLPTDAALRRACFRRAAQLFRACAAGAEAGGDADATSGPLECAIVYLVNNNPRREPQNSSRSMTSVSVATRGESGGSGGASLSSSGPLPRLLAWMSECLPITVAQVCVVPDPTRVPLYEFLAQRVPKLLHTLPVSLRSCVTPLVGDTPPTVLQALSRHLRLDPNWDDNLRSLLEGSLELDRKPQGKGAVVAGNPSHSPLQQSAAPLDGHRQDRRPSISSADLERALDRLSDADQAAIRTARQSTTIDADRECPPRWFRRRSSEARDRGPSGGNSEAGTADAAARDLARYWTNRRRVLGADAFCRPLHLLPSPQASDNAVRELRNSGAVRILPPDALGRTVLALDHTLVPFVDGQRPDGQCDRLRRFFFHALHGAVHRAPSRPVPLVLLHVLPPETKAPAGKSDHPHTTPSFPSLAAEVLRFPASLVDLRVIHVVVPPPSTLGPTLRRRTLSTMVDGVLLENQRPEWWIHAAPTADALLDRLASCGLVDASHLPPSVGGTWNPPAPSRTPEPEPDPDPYASDGATHELYPADEEDPPSPGMDPPPPRPPPPIPPVRAGKAVPGPGATVATAVSRWHRVTPQIEAKGLEELESAIALLPTEEKECLLRARRECPDLVQKESQANQFLLVCQFNAWSAARRLAHYWYVPLRSTGSVKCCLIQLLLTAFAQLFVLTRNERCDVFKERAFLPLNQTGEGALSREDVAVLRMGFYAFMRPDAHGRSVLLYDSSRRGESTQLARLRIAFYMASIVGENPKTQEEGFVTVAAANLSLDSVSRRIASLIANTLPIRMHSFHVVYCPTVGQKAIVAVATRLVLNVVGFLLGDAIQIHVGKSKDDIAATLKSHGLEKESLPQYLGGDWDHEALEEFNDLRIRYEWGLPSDAKRRSPHGIPDYVVKPRSDLTEEERIERKRRLNVLNSRRKRGRVRVEVEVLQSQVFDMQEQQRRLQEESDRLEGLLQDARTCVQQCQKPPPAAPSRLEARLAHPTDPMEFSSMVQLSQPINSLAGLPRHSAGAPVALPGVAGYAPLHSAASANAAALAAQHFPLAAALSALDNRTALGYNLAAAAAAASADPRTSHLAQALVANRRLVDDEAALSRHHLVLSQMAAQDRSTLHANLALADWRNSQRGDATAGPSIHASRDGATGQTPNQAPAPAAARQLPEHGFLGYWYH